MAQLGTNISYGGGIPVAGLQRLGISAVRVVAKAEFQDGDYFAQLRDAGLRIWLVFARESFDGFASLTEGIDEYRRRYESFVDTWEVGNEPDHWDPSNPSSWTLAHGAFSQLLQTARDRLGSGATICAGGLASGIPGWLGGDDPSWMQHFGPPDGYDFSLHGQPIDLQQANGVAIHPYGQAPGEPFPFEPAGYFGRVTGLLMNYRQFLDGRGLNQRLHITEWGAPVHDFETGEGGLLEATDRPRTIVDYLRRLKRRYGPAAEPELTLGNEAPPSQQAIDAHEQYMNNMVQTLASTDLAGDAIHFCYTDAMVGGFGLTDREFNDQPACTGFLAGMAAAGLVVA